MRNTQFQKFAGGGGGYSPRFDIIVLSDLFEHVRNPNAILDIAFSLLNAGGYLLIYLPVTSSLSQFILRRRWTYFVAEHLFSYSKNNIKQILLKHNFSVKAIKATPKYLNARYAVSVLKSRNTFTDNLFAGIINLCPKFLTSYYIPIRVGQITVLAQK
jgi:2-polyprenyl-3-methyl-5-hydroxy-6-metoxy-1,4-benzoquinol methylase